MKTLVIIVAMATVVIAYKDRRSSFAQPVEDFPPYQRARQQPPFQGLNHPYREQALKMQEYQSYRNRPYRQDTSSYSDRLSFKEQSLLEDYLSSNRPFFGDSSFFKDASDFKRESSFFLDGIPFKDQQFKDATPFRNEQFSQDNCNDECSHQQFPDDFRFSDVFNKPISSYKGQELQKQKGTTFRDPEYLKYGNHGFGYVSMPPISPYENALSLSEGTSKATAPTSTHKPLLQSTVSGAISQVHTSATSEPKMAPLKALHKATTVKSDTLTSASVISASTPTAATMPAALAASKQSSNLAGPRNALTTVSNLPAIATESPIMSFGRQTLPPIEFQASKFSSSLPYYDDSNSLKNKLLDYLLSQQAKTAIKTNEEGSLNYVLSDVPNNSFSNKIPSYILPQGSKIQLKDSLQTSLLNYLLQQEPNRGLPFQQSSLPEPMNYVPLATLAERPKIALPNVPMATLSAVSRPLQTMNYISAGSTMPRVPTFVAQHSPTNIIPLGSSVSSNLVPSITTTQAASIFNSLPSGISSGVSAGIPSNISPSIPASMSAALNFGQNLQHVDPLRQFEATRSQPYSTGLQLQLGGFGGLDYTLRSSNPAPRSVDFGITKMGFSLPELTQQPSSFSKVYKCTSLHYFMHREASETDELSPTEQTYSKYVGKSFYSSSIACPEGKFCR